MTVFGFMITPQFGMLNMWEVVLIVAVVVLLFGARKLPDLARGLGQGIKEFKRSSREDGPKEAPKS